jgi:CoA:oxalate CoA-transferase
MKVDVSMLDGQIAILESAVMRYAATGQTPVAIGNRHPSIAPFQTYATADAPVVIAVGNDQLFGMLCRALGLPHLPGDPRFASNAARLRHVDELQQELEAVLRTAPAAKWIERLEGARVPCGPVNNIAQAMEHPQVRARNMVVQAGGLRMAGNPIKLSAFADPPTREPAPDLDADGARIREEMRAGERKQPEVIEGPVSPRCGG